MQHQQLIVYGLDIETDTSCNGLDPAVAPVRAVALSRRAGDELFIGEEVDLLRALDRRLAQLPPGVIATWNGATFDLPFLADRARILGVDLGLRLCLDRGLTLHRTPLPGHAGAYRGSWHGHSHLDTYRLYGERRDGGARPTLRSLGRRLGLGNSPERHVRSQDLTNEALHAHAPSDARLARALAERRGAAVLRFVDQVHETEAEVVAVAARRLARRDTTERVVLRPIATI